MKEVKLGLTFILIVYLKRTKTVPKNVNQLFSSICKTSFEFQTGWFEVITEGPGYRKKLSVKCVSNKDHYSSINGPKLCKPTPNIKQ